MRVSPTYRSTPEAALPLMSFTYSRAAAAPSTMMSEVTV